MRIVRVTCRHAVLSSLGGQSSARDNYEVNIKGVTRLELKDGCIIVHGGPNDLILPVIPLAHCVQMWADATAPDTRPR